MRKGLFDKKPEPVKVPDPVPAVEPEAPTVERYGGHYWPKDRKPVRPAKANKE